MEKKQTQTHRRILRKAIGTGLLGFLLLVLFFVVFVRYLGQSGYKALSEVLSSNFGLWGIFLYNYICEALPTPFPTNISFALAAQMDPKVIIPLISLAGYLGSSTAYCIGRFLDHVPFIRRQSDKILAKWGAVINHYGCVFLVFSGLLPMPFTTICIVSGIVRMDARKVLPCLLNRVLRAILYFYAFRLGFFHLT